MVFKSMGCAVVVEGASAAELERVRTLFDERDATFSRFRPDSELNRVNALSGATVVSPLFARMVEAALRASEATGALASRFLARGEAIANASWLAQDPGVPQGVAARLRPDAEAVRARADGDLGAQPPGAGVDRVDDAVPAA
jgi:hypothetical protein